MYNLITKSYNFGLNPRKYSLHSVTKRSGYYRNLGSLRAGTRHHGEFSVMGTPSLQPFLKTYWLTPVNDWPIVAKHANMTSSRGSINAAPATITSESDTERRLAERAAITAITVMSHSRSQGTEVTIVTGAFPFELPRDITENSPLWERYSIPPWERLRSACTSYTAR